MLECTSPAQAAPLEPAVRTYLATIGAKGGHATKGSLKLSLTAMRNAPSTWRIRRFRYGPTGRRQPWQIKAAKLQAALQREQAQQSTAAHT